MARQDTNCKMTRNVEGYYDSTFYGALKKCAKRTEDIYEPINIEELMKGVTVTTTMNGKTTVIRY